VTIPGLQIDLESDVPVYRQIADGVRDAAVEGRLQAGRRLPPTRDLARHLGVNRNTVVAAYEQLAADGWVESRTGRGTFLAHDSARRPSGTVEGEAWFYPFSRAVEGEAIGRLASIYGLAIANEGISFVGSYPTAELMPVEPFADAIAEAVRRHGPEVLSYGPTAGWPRLREQIAARMREEGSSIGSGDVLVTNGAQQAIHLVFRTLLDPGDAAVIEEPTYTGALSVLDSVGGRTIGVPVDDRGMRPELLALALERHRPRLIYLQPTFHNPTTAVMDEARRREILRVAHRFRCPIVEDDWAGDLRLEGERLPSLHALDGGRQVIYLSTFSKKLMPGLRVGWVVAPPAVQGRLLELKRVEDCGTSPVLQAALELFLERGGLEAHLDRIRPAYRKRRDCMIGSLQRHFPRSASWTRPAGGLFLWIRLPAGFDGGELFAAARREGVLFSRGDLFHSDGSGRNCFRLTYSSASPEQIEEGIAKLGSLVRERLDRQEPKAQAATEAMPIL
jgi:GntR family transcriptional regulator/MocR family aminotransferase